MVTCCCSCSGILKPGWSIFYKLTRTTTRFSSNWTTVELAEEHGTTTKYNSIKDSEAEHSFGDGSDKNFNYANEKFIKWCY